MAYPATASSEMQLDSWSDTNTNTRSKASLHGESRKRDFTPIKIRGKKRSKDGSIPPHEAARSRHGSKTQHTTTGIYSLIHPQSRPASRPHSSHSNLGSTSSLSRSRQPRTPPQKHLSHLESLPVELLQHIFLLTCNTSLPRASPYIGSRLSSPHVYREYLARVFCTVQTYNKNIWRLECGVGGYEREELVQMRCEALRCRWLNWERYSTHKASALAQERERLESVFMQHTSRRYREFYMHGLDLWLGPGCTIPSKLLISPCEGPRFEFLRELIRSGAVINGTSSLDLETVADLWLDACRQGNYRLVHLLLAPGIYKPTEPEMLKALAQASNDKIVALLILQCHYVDKDQLSYWKEWVNARTLPQCIGSRLAIFAWDYEGLKWEVAKPLFASVEATFDGDSVDLEWERVVLKILPMPKELDEGFDEDDGLSSGED